MWTGYPLFHVFKYTNYYILYFVFSLTLWHFKIIFLFLQCILFVIFSCFKLCMNWKLKYILIFCWKCMFCILKHLGYPLRLTLTHVLLSNIHEGLQKAWITSLRDTSCSTAQLTHSSGDGVLIALNGHFTRSLPFNSNSAKSSWR